jgi:membrane protein implicated in regulation of membrane protease activity
VKGLVAGTNRVLGIAAFLLAAVAFAWLWWRSRRRRR